MRKGIIMTALLLAFILGITYVAYGGQGTLIENVLTDTASDGTWITNGLQINNWFVPVSNKTGISDGGFNCTAYENSSGSYSISHQWIGLENGTNKTFGLTLQDSLGISVDTYVNCTAGDGNWTRTDTVKFGVDSNAPTVLIDSTFPPITSSGQTYGYTPTDTNLDTCLIQNNVTGTFGTNITNSTGMTSGTKVLNYEQSTADGRYIYSVTCNDTAANIASSKNLTFIVDATAPAAFSITAPTNNTVSTNLTPRVTWDASSDVNFQSYILDVSNHADFSATNQSFNFSATTDVTQVLKTLADGITYWFRVTAYDKAGNTIAANEIRYITDSTGVSVNKTLPENYSYHVVDVGGVNASITVSAIPIGTNVDVCGLHISQSNASEETFRNLTYDTVTTLTEFSWVLNVTPGTYQYNIECNDTYGTLYNASSSLLAFYVDGTAPNIQNLTTASGIRITDGTPTLNWTSGMQDVNFSHYLLDVSATPTFTTSITTVNLSENVTGYTFSQLGLNRTLYFNLTAFDAAGNSQPMGNTTGGQNNLTITQTCGNLSVGWTGCSPVRGEAMTLEQLCTETSCAEISYWEPTNSTFITFTTGETTNAGLKRSIGQGYLLRVSSETLWENRSWELNFTSKPTVTLNATAWNYVGVPIRNGTTFAEIDTTEIVGNYSQASYYDLDNTSFTYTPFIPAWDYNENKFIDFGEALWIYVNSSADRVYNWT